jgi:DNA repair protein RecO
MARGVRREKSRLSGGIELFAVCDVVITDGKGELGVLISARLVEFYRNIMADYDRMQFAYLAVKLVSKASEMVDGPEWYDVLASVLGGLDNALIQLELIQTWFYLRYSALMGYELSLWHDVKGEKLLFDQIYNYDNTEQGLIVASGGSLAADHIKLLRLIATRPLKTVAQIGGIESILPECLFVARQHAAI